jgi:hypothetical protein
MSYNSPHLYHTLKTKSVKDTVATLFQKKTKCKIDYEVDYYLRENKYCLDKCVRMYQQDQVRKEFDPTLVIVKKPRKGWGEVVEEVGKKLWGDRFRGKSAGDGACGSGSSNGPNECGSRQAESTPPRAGAKYDDPPPDFETIMKEAACSSPATFHSMNHNTEPNAAARCFTSELVLSSSPSYLSSRPQSTVLSRSLDNLQRLNHSSQPNTAMVSPTHGGSSSSRPPNNKAERCAPDMSRHTVHSGPSSETATSHSTSHEGSQQPEQQQQPLALAYLTLANQISPAEFYGSSHHDYSDASTHHAYEVGDGNAGHGDGP